MLRNTKLRRFISAFLLINMLYYTFLPSLSYALTSGPTAPEATSFEPVDTTDMVNLLTGDFVYNLPLLEVPGPAGGYPLSMAYHAGIQPNEDASWVGLGWNLNTGAITRNVNGFADDHFNVSNLDRFYWEGGSRKTYRAGVSVGISGLVSVSGGLSFSQDTYLGFGMGAYSGFGLGLVGFGNDGSGIGSLGVGGQVGVDPFGGAFASAGLGAGIARSQNSALGLSSNLGISTNFKSVGGFAGTSVDYSSAADAKGNRVSNSLLGATISTQGIRPSLSVGGGTVGVNNSKRGNIQTRSKGFGFAIPLPAFSVSLGYNYTRYWIDEMDEVATNGVLHFKDGDLSTSFFDDHAFDTYALLDPDENFVQNPDPQRHLGGSYPNYDNYYVNAQGIGGQIRPYLFQKNLMRQNVGQDGSSPEIQHLSLGNEPTPAGFRFINDFSNRYSYEPADFNAVSDPKPLAFDFGWTSNPVTGENGGDGISNNHLAGSKHIESFANLQITDAIDRGFRETQSSGFVRSQSNNTPQFNNQIGGFMVANESGVNYHFALPVYSKDEYMRSENIEGTETFNELRKPERYAYTWYLTSITGPDYVDKNLNGFADQGDWGYWVSFDYGKWTDDFQWRNPSEGTNQDLDQNFETYANGKKELYYLDAVKTSTHTALFVKDIRADGKGVINADDANMAGTNDIYPRATLKLNRIILLKNEVLENEFPANLKGLGNKFDFSFDDGGTSKLVHRGDDVLDESDLVGLNDELMSRSIRTIGFDYDYSLTQGTFNSYDPEGTMYSSLPDQEAMDTKLGKLSLKSIHFLGKGGAEIIPPMNLGYSKNHAYHKDAVDMWGHYKSDYADTGNEYLDRMVSHESAENVDTWSLTDIETSLGATIHIDYEADDYSESVLSRNFSLTANAVVPGPEDRVKFYLAEPIDLSLVNVQRDFVEVVFGYQEETLHTGANCDPGKEYKPAQVLKRKLRIESVDNEQKIIEVRDQGIRDIISTFIINGTPAGESAPPSGTDFSDCGEIVSNKIIAANLALSNTKKYGGGIRVKQVEVEDPLTNTSSVTAYEYTAGPGISSGTTSYEPSGLNNFNILFSADRAAEDAYVNALYNSMARVLANAREVPAPGVLYEYVTIREKNITFDGVEHVVPGHTTYQFEVFDEGMINVHDLGHSSLNKPPGTYEGRNYAETKVRKLALKNYTSRVGSLKRITLYNPEGQKISETINEYLHDNLDGTFVSNVNIYEGHLAEPKYKNQGVIEETFADARFVKHEHGADYDLLGVISKKEEFPAIQTGVININYKTGITSSVSNLSHDFYSGEVLREVSKDGYGNVIVSEKVPAYHHYAGMGLKINGEGNANMLTQSAASSVYKVDNETNLNPVGLISAAAQTWKKEGRYRTYSSAADRWSLSNVGNGVWRAHKNFNWQGDEQNLREDGTYVFPLFENFSWWDGTDPADQRWQQNSEITLYDPFSHALEASDINRNYAATKISNEKSLVFATAANARYTEMAYSGAEDDVGAFGFFGGEVNIGNGQKISKDTHAAHSGEYSLMLEGQENGFVYRIPASEIEAGRNYHANVWVHQDNIANAQLYVKQGGTALVTQPYSGDNRYKAGEWHQIKTTVAFTGSGDIEVGCRNDGSGPIYVDDFRFQPVDATMTAYVYDQNSDELTHILDNNNLYTRYEYDAMGRLRFTHKETMQYGNGDNLISELVYNYARAPEDNLFSIPIDPVEEPDGINDEPHWQDTGERRCAVDLNDDFDGRLEKEQTDMNSSSPQTRRWVFEGYNPSLCPSLEFACGILFSNCVASCGAGQGEECFSDCRDEQDQCLAGDFSFPIWTKTGAERCQVDEFGSYTGMMEVEMRDVNTVTAVLGETSWQPGSIDEAACPLPDWREVSTECVTNSCGDNTAEFERTERDMASGSATEGQTRAITGTDEFICPLPNQFCLDQLENCARNCTSQACADDCQSTFEQCNATYFDPQWEDTNTICIIGSDGSYTGQEQVEQIDVNCRSQSFNQTRTITRINTASCPLPDWREVNTVCMTDSCGDNTGQFERTERDMASGSATQGQTRIIAGTDELICPLPNQFCIDQLENCARNCTDQACATECQSTFDQCNSAYFNPNWEDINTTCIIGSDGSYSGQERVDQKDVNCRSQSFNQTRTITRINTASCPLPDWREVNTVCMTDGCGDNTGQFERTERDMASGSATQGQTRIIAGTDELICPLPNQFCLDQLENCARNCTSQACADDCQSTFEQCNATYFDPQWTTLSSTCLTNSGCRTGEQEVTERDDNCRSTTYNVVQTRTVTNHTACPPQPTGAQWALDSEAWCEFEDCNYTGRRLIGKRDVNSCSSTFGDRRIFEFGSCTPGCATDVSFCDCGGGGTPTQP